MHAFLAHAYHLAQFGLHVAGLAVWRPLAACLGLALLGRALGMAGGPRGAALVAGGAVLAGWLVQVWTLAPFAWPPPPISRLPGLALIVLVGAMARAQGRPSRLLLPAIPVLAAWWLRGAPLDGPGLAGCLPVSLGLAAGLAVSRGTAGWATLAAAVTLGGALAVAGAAPHWAKAALVPALGALAMVGVADAMPVLAGMVVALSAAALVASDRGRVVPVDVACLVPLSAFFLAKKKQKPFVRLPRTQPTKVFWSFFSKKDCLPKTPPPPANQDKD